MSILHIISANTMKAARSETTEADPAQKPEVTPAARSGSNSLPEPPAATPYFLLESRYAAAVNTTSPITAIRPCISNENPGHIISIDPTIRPSIPK